MDLPTPERILIVRLTAIGDVIHGAPVANALRDRFPDAHIGWVVEGAGGELLEGHRAINELIRVPRRWYKSPRQIMGLRRRLRALRFDTAIDLQGLTKSSAAAWISGARQRLGASGRWGREFSKQFNNVLTPVESNHVIHHYLNILRPLGIGISDAGQPAGFSSVRFDFEEHGADAEFAEQTLRSLGLEQGGFAVLNAGAGWDSKVWPPERYGELARRIAARRHTVSLALWGGPEEKPLAEAIVRHSNGAAVLAPPTTLRQVAELCRRAGLFVGSDTGPMHLAAAVGATTLSLHGVTSREWCGAYGPGNLAIQSPHPLPPPLRSDDNSAMRAITVEMVDEACERLLSRGRRAAA